jgi:dTDP-glucose 4,6-dehydratase
MNTWLIITYPNPTPRQHYILEYLKKTIDGVSMITWNNDYCKSKNMFEKFSNIIFLQCGWSERYTNQQNSIHLEDLFVPLYMTKLCKNLNIHFTWWIEDFFVSSIMESDCLKNLCENTTHLFIRCGKLIFDTEEDIKEICLSPGGCIHRNFAFCEESIPIILSLIENKKIGWFDVCNPIPLSCDNQKPFDNCEGYIYDTDRLTQEYFILPSYQAYQRCLKRVRKHKLYNHKVNLNQPCNILITGGYGFIGSNLVQYLFHKYPKTILTNIDRLDYCSRKEHVESLLKSDRFLSYQIDLSDTKTIQDILEERKIDYIFHLAAQSHVDNSFNNSLQFSIDNVMATHSLLEACKNYGNIKRFIHISTDEIYGETLRIKPFQETELPEPTNPYAATKVGAEFIAKSYYHCFELPVIIMRGNNVYGPHQYPEKMIPRFITLLLNQQPCTIAGNGMMKRNFIHVTDVCAGLCAILLHGKVDEIYNIGTDDEKSVIDVAKYLIKQLYPDENNIEKYLLFVKDRYYNDFRYSIDTTKIKNLGWSPKIEFSNGIKQTIDYYKDSKTIGIFQKCLL